MSAKGYITTAQVEAFLQKTLTAAQLAQCETLLESAETHVDNYCKRAWLTGVQTNETHYHPGHHLYLDCPPVQTVTSITGRSGMGATEETLTVDQDYELRDSAAGLIYLVYPGSYDRIRVTYTPVATVPADIKQACIELVAHWLRPALMPDSYGVQSFQLPDLSVTYRTYAAEAIPLSVQVLLNHYYLPVTA
jgi:hypothetical protein